MIRTHLLALLIAGVVLTITGCGGKEAESTVLMLVEIESAPIRGSCRDRYVNIYPIDGEQVSAAAENGVEVEEGTCRYAFSARVEDAASYTFKARDWPDVTLTADEIERIDVEGETSLHVQLDFRRQR